MRTCDCIYNKWKYHTNSSFIKDDFRKHHIPYQGYTLPSVRFCHSCEHNHSTRTPLQDHKRSAKFSINFKNKIIIIIIYSETNAWRNTLFHPSEHETNINYLETDFPPHRKHCDKENKVVWEIIYSESNMKLMRIILRQNAEFLNVKESRRCICNKLRLKR